MVSTDTDINNINAKQYFLNLCHDIRSPLNVIMGMTSLAMNELVNNNLEVEIKDKIHSYLSRVDTTSKFLLELINDILDISIIESGNFIINKEVFSLEQLIDSVKTMIEPQSAQKRQNFEIITEDINELILIGDFIRLNQILINLLSNAVKYTAVNGSVKLKIGQKKAENNKVILDFQIIDTGIGMPESFINTMFEPYKRAADMEQGRNSTGLGLFICKSLVTLMGGAIDVKSQIKVGTAITVELPFETVSGPDQKVPPKNLECKCGNDEKVCSITDFDFKGKHILIAEDNEDCMDIAVEILNYTGISVSCAKDGLAAIRLFEASSPGYFNAILMDVSMPIMNGYVATRRIRSSEHPDAKKIPIIAITANAFPEQVEASLESGMNEHVSKPINYYNLCAMLEKIFNNNRL